MMFFIYRVCSFSNFYVIAGNDIRSVSEVFLTSFSLHVGYIPTFFTDIKDDCLVRPVNQISKQLVAGKYFPYVAQSNFLGNMLKATC